MFHQSLSCAFSTRFTTLVRSTQLPNARERRRSEGEYLPRSFPLLKMNLFPITLPPLPYPTFLAFGLKQVTVRGTNLPFRRILGTGPFAGDNFSIIGDSERISFAPGTSFSTAPTRNCPRMEECKYFPSFPLTQVGERRTSACWFMDTRS